MDAYQLLVDQLNLALRRDREIDTVAANFALILAAESEDGRRRIYVAARSTLIGCNLDDTESPFSADIAWYHTDLITQVQAADLVGVSLAAISQSIRTGRLRAHRDFAAPAHQGRTLVRRADVERLWPK